MSVNTTSYNRPQITAIEVNASFADTAGGDTLVVRGQDLGPVMQSNYEYSGIVSIDQVESVPYQYTLGDSESYGLDMCRAGASFRAASAGDELKLICVGTGGKRPDCCRS